MRGHLADMEIQSNIIMKIKASDNIGYNAANDSLDRLDRFEVINLKIDSL